MKMCFNRQAMVDAFALLSSVVPSRTPKPVLLCVRIIAAEKEVRIQATDLEVGVNYLLSGVEVETPGQVVVPADRLAAIVRESTDDVLSLRVVDDSCEVTGADSRFLIYTHNPDDYPNVPDYDGQADIEIGLANLQAGIGQCLFATAKESSRYALNGILWQTKGKKLSLVATDGRRLARVRINLPKPPNKDLADKPIIIPAKTMSLLDKIHTGDKDVVAVRLVDNKIMIGTSQAVISSNLIQGNFPNYEDIIPADHDKKLTLSTEETLSAVRRAALLTSEESRGIKLSVDKQKLMFSGRAPETGDAQVEMATNYKGEPVDIGFNPQFLIDMLRAIKTENFEIELGQTDRPALFKSGKDFIYVLMPINLS